jgi:ribosomal protein S18 acetylase RimI-like enzyme
VVTSVLTDASAPAIIEALDRHEREVSVTYARALGGYVEDRPDMLVYMTGLPASFANGVKAPRLDEASADQAIEGVAQLLRSRGVAGTWSVGPLATPKDLGERLERAGFPCDFDLRMMVAEIGSLDLDPPRPPALSVRRVEDEHDHQAWLRVMEIGFDLPGAHTQTIDRTIRALGVEADVPWVRFVGAAEGTAVASSGLMLFGGLAGVYNVATVPEARRRGFGAAMTREAIRYGREAGYRVAALGASDMGRGVYERMGFRDVCVVSQYASEPPGP